MSEKIKPVSAAPAPAAVAKKPPNAMEALLASMAGGDDDDIIEIGELAPLTAQTALPRSPRAMPVTSLAGLARLWLLIGEGNSGKTTLARYLIDEVIAHGKLDTTAIAALAPGNRNLTSFVSVMQPPSTDPKATADYTRRAMAGLASAGRSGIFDFGGGDASLRYLIEAVPNLAPSMEDMGLALVPAYMLTPRSADLTFLNTFERLGFQPRATVLCLNLALADTPSAFDGLRRQPEYRAAIARGAVELWMPALSQEVALRIERAQVHFSQARDGEAPEGRKPANINLLERAMVREWLEAMDKEFSAISGWMPWE